MSSLSRRAKMYPPLLQSISRRPLMNHALVFLMLATSISASAEDRDFNAFNFKSCSPLTYSPASGLSEINEYMRNPLIAVVRGQPLQSESEAELLIGYDSRGRNPKESHVCRSVKSRNEPLASKIVCYLPTDGGMISAVYRPTNLKATAKQLRRFSCGSDCQSMPISIIYETPFSDGYILAPGYEKERDRFYRHCR